MGAVKLEEAAFQAQAATEQAPYCCASENKKHECDMAVGAEEEVGGDDNRELIPGLPDDVAMECLARVPSRSHRRMRRVCRGWRGAIVSSEFRRRRRIAGAAEDVVFLVQAAPAGGSGDGKCSAPACALAAANLTTGEWRRVEGPPVPLFAQCASAGDGRHVAVVGGWDPATLRPTRDVRVLDVPAGAWRRGRPMPGAARSFFGCAGGSGNGEVYVAGGHDGSKNALRSALAYGVAADAWRALPDMAEERDEPQLVAVPGVVLLAASGYPTEAQGAFTNTAECYYVAGAGDGAWASDGDVDAAPAGTCLASVRGNVWAVGAGKGGVRERVDGAWRDVADGPPGMKACVKAVGVGDGGAAVFVFGTVADAAAEGGRHAAWVMDDAATAAWRRVPVPPGFDGFVYSAAAVRI